VESRADVMEALATSPQEDGEREHEQHLADSAAGNGKRVEPAIRATDRSHQKDDRESERTCAEIQRQRVRYNRDRRDGDHEASPLR